MDWHLTPGDRIERAELHDRFGGRIHPRISPSKASPNIMLFSTRSAASRFDGWTGEHVHFGGEGGGDGTDQKLTQGNGALLRHENEGRVLRLFLQPESGPAEYIGAYQLDSHMPFAQVEAPEDPRRPLEVRQVFVFRLRPLTGPPRGLPHRAAAVTQRRVEKTGPGVRLTLPGQILAPAQQAAADMLARYEGFLRLSERSETAGYRITTGHSLSEIHVELFDHTREELVVPLASRARPGVWEALGRLNDQARFFTPAPRRALLLPGQPDPDLMDLLLSQHVTAIWPSGPFSYARSEPGPAGTRP
ncbi:hypothetical protein ACFC6U_27930 [Kitasatospora purpeofusca]|uniref:hypothetical protein n=1 Tax=Kitasatospora purpeofusca TaxID=67352 RepID=UPI0035D87331